MLFPAVILRAQDTVIMFLHVPDNPDPLVAQVSLLVADKVLILEM